jgi:hypothetical protein
MCQQLKIIHIKVCDREGCVSAGNVNVFRAYDWTSAKKKKIIIMYGIKSEINRKNYLTP